MIRLLIIIALINRSKCSSNTCIQLDDYCRCDGKCVTYGDCCPGHENYNRPAQLDHILTCKPLPDKRNVWIIDRCSEKNHKFEDLCTKRRILDKHRLLSLIAVIGVNGQVFENAFCARCNNQNRYKYSHAVVNCQGVPMKDFSSQQVVDIVNSGHECNVTNQLPRRIRTCVRDLIRHCPENYKQNNLVKENCEQRIFEYPEPLMSDERHLFRNKHCCECWNTSCSVSGRKYENGFKKDFAFFLNFNEWEQIFDFNLTVGGRNDTTKSTEAQVLYYVSLALTLLSILSLIILISIYMIHSTFHNFGGYLTLCLSSCLLVTDVLILVSTSGAVSGSRYCRIFGIAMHYFATTNFIWMAIYALDLMQTFVFKSANGHETKSCNTFIIYLISGFGMAAIIVGSASIFEYSLNENNILRPSYGGENCWFTSRVGGIIWYFTPSCFMLAWNTISCVLVFYKLSKSASDCRIVRRKESRNTLGLCVRLTAVFGLCYIVQVVLVCSGVKMAIIAGSLVTCLQGCFLAICFLWTNRVQSVVVSSLSSISGSKYNHTNVNSKKSEVNVKNHIKETTSCLSDNKIMSK